MVVTVSGVSRNGVSFTVTGGSSNGYMYSRPITISHADSLQRPFNPINNYRSTLLAEAVVGAGAMLIRDVAAGAVVVGNPLRRPEGR